MIIAFLIVMAIYLSGGHAVVETAQENSKDVVSGGLGGCAVLLWVLGIGFILYCMAAVMATGG